MEYAPWIAATVMAVPFVVDALFWCFCWCFCTVDDYFRERHMREIFKNMERLDNIAPEREAATMNDENERSVASTGSIANTKITARNCSAADWCRLNGWGVGTILEGDGGCGPERIVITAVGEDSILAKLIGGPDGDRSWVLWGRDWKRPV